jgi:IS1 family transposase
VQYRSGLARFRSRRRAKAEGDRSFPAFHCYCSGESYRECRSFSNFWAAYQKVFPDETHEPTEKGSGETSRLERWNLHIRQRLARFGRKRLAFSKPGAYHRWVTKWFIHEYNLSVSTSD